MDNIMRNIYDKKITLTNLNFRLNANEDLLILPHFWVTSQNTDSYFNNLNKLVFQTVEPYKLNF